MARQSPGLSFAALPLRGLALGAYASIRVLPRAFRTSCSDGLEGPVSSVLQAASPPQVQTLWPLVGSSERNSE